VLKPMVLVDSYLRMYPRVCMPWSWIGSMRHSFWTIPTMALILSLSLNQAGCSI